MGWPPGGVRAPLLPSRQRRTAASCGACVHHRSDPPGAAAQLPADRQHAQTLVSELEDCFVSGPLGPPSTEGLSLYPGPRQPGS